MANKVYANGREIACKAADGKSTSACPDVCFLPPDKTPATPLGIPTPLPNTAFASDTTDGSKNVKISDKEIVLKPESYFKKSTGNEASKATQKKGFVTSTEEGQAHFNSCSMDVKFEGDNVARHLDLMTHNHASKQPGQTPPWAYTDTGAFATSDACAEDRKKIKTNCTGDKKTDCPKPGPGFKTDPCVQAKRCQLVPYRPKSGCCPGQTGHHLVPKRAFKGRAAYNPNKAPCVCAEGFSWHRNDASAFPSPEKTHPDLHDVQDYLEREAIDAPAPGRSPDAAMTYGETRNSAVSAHQAVFPQSGCDPDCLKAQLDAYHKEEAGIKEDEPIRTPGGLRRLDQIEKTARDPSLVAKAKELLAEISREAAAIAKATPPPI